MQLADGVTEAKTVSKLPLILDVGPKILAGLATGSLMASVAFQLGYLTVIDVRLAALFSFQDALLGAISTLPILVAAIPIIWGSSISIFKWVPRVSGWLKSSKVGGHILLLSLFTLAVIFAVFISAIVALLLLLIGSILYNIRERELTGLSPLLIKVVCTASYATIGLVTFFFAGAFLANSNISDPSRPYKLTLSNGTAKDVNLLLLGQSNMILLEEGTKILIVPRGEVTRLERLVGYHVDVLISVRDVWELAWAYVGGRLPSCVWNGERYLCRDNKLEEKIPLD